MATQQPAGWYPDAQGVTRWWDGNQWTEHTQAGGGQQQQHYGAGRQQQHGGGQQHGGAQQYGASAGAAGPAKPKLAKNPTLLAIAIFGAVIAAVGSLGPWASLGSVEQTGTEGGDGYIVIVCVAIAAVMLFVASSAGKRWPTIVAAVFGAIALLVGIVDFQDISDKGLDLGWGMFLVLAGTAAVTLLSSAVVKRPG